MALNQLGLGFVFTGRDLASGAINRVRRNFIKTAAASEAAILKMNAAAVSLGVGLGIAVVGLAGFVAAGALANVAGEFGQNLAAAGKIARATEVELRQLEQAAIDAGIATQFSPTEAVKGLTSLAAAGQNARNSMTTLIPVLDLAAGSLGQLGVGEAAEVTSGILNAFGFEASQATRRVDQLLAITQRTNLQARDFATTLGVSAAQANAASQSFEEMVTVLGVLRSASVPASRAATAFREAVRRLSSDQQALTKLTELGISPIDKQTGKMKALSSIVGELVPKFEGMNDVQKNTALNTLFGARGMAAFNAISTATFETMRGGNVVVLKGVEAFRAIRKEIEEASGTAAEFRDTLLDTFEGQKTLLRGTLQTFAIVLGKPFAEVFKPIVKAVVGGLNFFLRIFTKIPAPIKRVLAVLTLLTSLFLTFAGGAIAVSAAATLLSFAAGAIGSAISAVIPIILATGAAILFWAAIAKAAFFIFQNNLGGIADVMEDIFGKVKLFVDAVTQLFKQGGFSGAIMDELGKAENEGIKGFAVAIFGTFFRIRRFVDGFIDGFRGAIEVLTPVFKVVGEQLNFLAESIFGVGGEARGAVAGIPSDKFKEIGERIGFVVGSIVAFMASLIGFAASVVGVFVRVFRFLNKVRKFTNALLNPIGTLVNKLRPILGRLREGENPAEATTTELFPAIGRAAAGENPAAAAAGGQAETTVFAASQFEGLNVTAVLEVDGEVLAAKTMEAQRREDARGFVPVPTPG